MSNRIPINRFGSALNSDNSGGLSQAEADIRYINATGDKMMEDLDMSDNIVKNLKEPEESDDASTKKYVDDRIAELQLAFTRQTDSIKALEKTHRGFARKLETAKTERINFKFRANSKTFLKSFQNVFVAGIWFRLSENVSDVWVDSNSTECKGLKYSIKKIKTKVIRVDEGVYFYCENESLPKKFTGDAVLLLIEGNDGFSTEIPPTLITDS